MAEENKLFCPHCAREIPEEEVSKFIAARAGRSKSEKKSRAARENGKKGGRPKKKK